MTEALLVVLALGHYGYEASADLLATTPQRIWYVFQALLGGAAFYLAGLRCGERAAARGWPEAARLALYCVALAGVAEQALAAGCGCARLWAPVFRAPRGEGLCGGGWYGAGMAVLTWLALLVYRSRKGSR